MSEHEQILQKIKARLRQVPGIAIVTRSLRKASSINEMPSVTLIDLGDKVDEQSIGPLVTRTTHIGLSIVFQGSSEEKAPEEIAAFEDDIRRAMLGDELRQAIGSTVRACFYETSVSEISYPRETSGRIVQQEICFDVVYAADFRTV